MTRTHANRRIAGIVSVALALGIAAPAGAVSFDLNGSATMVPARTMQSPPPAVQPNPDQQVPQAGVVATHGIAHPALSTHYRRPGLSSYGGPITGGNPRPVQHTTHNPFDWGDAAVGAAAGLAISLLIVGVVLTVARRRQAGPGASTAIAG